MYRNLTKLFLAGVVAVALLATGGTTIPSQAKAQGHECGDGMTELLLVLPNGVGKFICVPDFTVGTLEAATDNEPIDFITFKTVFVTSGLFSGDLISEADTLTGTLAGTGVTAADLICQRLAEDAGFVGPYRAWIADDSDDPDTGFVQSTVPYVLTDGTIVADNWTDLTDGSLDHAINIDEMGNPAAAALVWTNVKSDGTRRVSDGAVNCQGWSISEPLGDDAGIVGSPNAVDAGWTDLGNVFCGRGSLFPLYCFGQ